MENINQILFSARYSGVYRRAVKKWGVRVRHEIINDGTCPPLWRFVYSLCDGSIGIVEKAKGIEGCARTYTDPEQSPTNAATWVATFHFALFVHHVSQPWNSLLESRHEFLTIQKNNRILVRLSQEKPTFQQVRISLLKPISPELTVRIYPSLFVFSTKIKLQ